MVRVHDPRRSRSEFSSRPRRVPVAVLASRWHFNYEHYAAVLEVRAQGQVTSGDDIGPGSPGRAPQVPECAASQTSPANLMQYFSRAIDTLRRRRGGALEPQPDLSRAS